MSETVATWANGSSTGLADVAKPVRGIDFPAAPIGYVSPQLTELVKDAGTRAVIVEAAGAVGKSAAAKFISSNRDWPLVDAGKIQVGHYGLTGLITSAWPKGDFLGEFAIGRVGVVIDALDEAHLKAGAEGLMAFLSDVTNLAKTPSKPGVAAVLMTRPETAEYVKLAFEEAALPYSRYRLAYFAAEAARSFITEYLRSQASADARQTFEHYRTNMAGLQELREVRLLSIAREILGRDIPEIDSAWDELSSFLGYAPVLGVLAESLAVSNPFKDAQHDEQQTRSSTGAVLTRLTQALLEREGDKFRGQVGPRLVAATPATSQIDPSMLYTPDEQIRRLGAQLMGSEVKEPLVVPDAVAADYESAVATWISEHPFLGTTGAGSVVFRDRIIAGCIADTIASSHGAACAEEVGPFLWRFLQEISAQDEGIPTVPEAALLSVTTSWMLGAQRAWLYFQEEDAAELQLLEIGASRVPISYMFAVTGLSGFIEFPRLQRGGVVITDGGVGLGSGSRFELGSGVMIRAGFVHLDVAELQVGPGPAWIMADEFDAGRLTRVNVMPGATFGTVGASAWPVLRPHEEISADDRGVGYAWYVDLRAILRGFSKRAAGEISIYAEKLDQGVVKDNVQRQKILRGLTSMGIIVRVESHYNLDVSVLGEYGVSIASISSGDPDADVMGFLAEVAALAE